MNKAKVFAVLSAILALWGCGEDSSTINASQQNNAGVKDTVYVKDGLSGYGGTSCTVVSLDDGSGYKIICGQDSVGVLLNGRDGRDGRDGTDGTNGLDGKDGVDGRDGTSCSVEPLADDAGYKVVCGTDSIGVLLHGTNGLDGKDGKNGEDGTSCSTVSLSDNSGMKILCGGDSVGVVLNGHDGKNGFDGKDGTDGADGEGCFLEQIDANTLRIVCGKDSAIILVNEVRNPNSSSSSLILTSSSSVDYLATPCNINGVDRCRHGVLTDKRDGKEYLTVAIGDQVWMAENLDYVVDGSVIYNNAKSGYGRLYRWTTAIGMSESECGYGVVCALPQNHQGICPQGWHLPDKIEWQTLVTMAGSGKNLKSTYGWDDFNGEYGGGTDLFSFSAQPVGLYYALEGIYSYVGEKASFWYTTEIEGFPSQYAGSVGLNNADDFVAFGNNNDKRYVYNSVRCVMNKN